MLRNGYGNKAKMPQIMQAATVEKPSKQISTKVVSSTPGRLRLRVAQGNRQPGEMARLAKALKANPRINNIRTNAEQGSITIEHEGGDGSLDDVLATLRDVGIIFGDLTHGNSKAAAGLTNALADLNKRVAKGTNGVIDLRVLFPLGLSALAVRQLMIRGLQFELIPWYVLAWYAFDSFIKLNNTGGSQSSGE